MKKNSFMIFSALLFISAALGGCRSAIQPERPQEHQVTFMAVSDAATRTYLSEGEDRKRKMKTG